MNEAQFNNAVNTYGKGLLHFVCSNLKDMDESRSIVQDTFETLWLKRDQIITDSIKSFLFTVAYRKTIDYLRKHRFTEMVPDLNTEALHAHDDGTKDLVHKALKQLPDLQRQLIELRDLHGYDYKEIERIMDLKESQVKVYLFRARQSLKTIITQLEAVKL